MLFTIYLNLSQNDSKGIHKAYNKQLPTFQKQWCLRNNIGMFNVDSDNNMHTFGRAYNLDTNTKIMEKNIIKYNNYER